MMKKKPGEQKKGHQKKGHQKRNIKIIPPISKKSPKYAGHPPNAGHGFAALVVSCGVVLRKVYFPTHVLFIINTVIRGAHDNVRTCVIS